MNARAMLEQACMDKAQVTGMGAEVLLDGRLR